MTRERGPVKYHCSASLISSAHLEGEACTERSGKKYEGKKRKEYEIMASGFKKCNAPAALVHAFISILDEDFVAGDF